MITRGFAEKMSEYSRMYRRMLHDTYIHSTPKSYGIALQSVRRKKKKKR